MQRTYLEEVKEQPHVKVHELQVPWVDVVDRIVFILCGGGGWILFVMLAPLDHFGQRLNEGEGGGPW